MKNITTPEQAQAQSAAYRKTCGARRRGKVVEVLQTGTWTVDKEFRSVNQAKHACRGGKYRADRVYAL